MKIVNLIEDTKGKPECKIQHGLSFYIETDHHKLLMDTGASGLFLENARILGIDLKQVDTVIISHGHYDHGGGILSFIKINPDAKIYVQKAAFEQFYSIYPDAENPRYIGLDPRILEHEQVVLLEGDCEIDEELFLFSGIGSAYPIPSANKALKQKIQEEFLGDDFRHEQCLVICQAEQSVLLSGCAHNGILNILERYREIFQEEPDIVISGFHMQKKRGFTQKDYEEIVHTAFLLKKTAPVFYTCHCTGALPYEVMKSIMGKQLKYIHCGKSLTFTPKKKRFPFIRVFQRSAADHL